MADGYDRFENEGSGGGSFVMGLLTGTVLGAGLGMLFAPKPGSELRGQLSEQAANLATQARDGVTKVTENAGEWADRGRDIYGKAREAVVKGADEAQKYVRDNAGPVKDAVNSIKDTAAAAVPSLAGAGAGTGSGSGSTYGGSTENMRGSGSDATRGSHSSGSPSTASSGTGPSSTGPGSPRRS